MRKVIWILLALCVSLQGCVVATESDPTAQSVPTAGTHGPIQAETVDPERRPMLPPTQPAKTGETLRLGNCGGTRTGYAAVLSSVRYITEASQLPKYEALAGYDDAYFETGALVLVLETVASGSVQVGIESVTVEDDLARVTLSHELPGDAATPAITTWLVWAEVEQGLDYRWQVENPAMKSELEEY